MLTREQTEFFLVKAYNAALRAGARILDIYNDGVDIEVNLKSDRTPITLADCESHTLIKSYLGPTHIPLLSEEGRESGEPSLGQISDSQKSSWNSRKPMS